MYNGGVVRISLSLNSTCSTVPYVIIVTNILTHAYLEAAVCIAYHMIRIYLRYILTGSAHMIKIC